MTIFKEPPTRSVLIGPQARVGTSDVASLLPRFGSKYPGGMAWLDRRLDEAGSGRARAWLSMVDGAIAAFAIETPKGLRRSKLSTFAVAPRYRGRGVGSALLRGLRDYWLSHRIDDVHVTVDQADAVTGPFFESHGFEAHPAILIPYGPDRFDRLYRWSAAENAVPILLLSIRPPFAEAIYSRRKTFEFRRTPPRRAIPGLALIYETLPIGRLTGVVAIDRVVHLSKGQAKDLAGVDDPFADAYEDYLAGGRSPCALALSGSERFAAPARLEEITPLKRPPSPFAMSISIRERSSAGSLLYLVIPPHHGLQAVELDDQLLQERRVELRPY